VIDSANNRVQEWTPSLRPGNEGAHDIRTVYYSAEEESEVATCRKHPEWVNLPCQTEPAAQTGVSGSPELPVITFTYNMWDEVETTAEKFGTGSGTVTRTKTQEYDSAGRALTSQEKAEPVTDTALPKVTNVYNKETGALETQSATIKKGTKEETKTTTSVLNTLGELEKYTDAEGGTSTYVYNLEGQVEEVNDGQAEKEGVQTYAYAAKTGYLEKLVDSSAGTFTATYDVEGKMLTENYPNGMTARYTYNQVGAATGIEYKKEKDCAGTCPETWFSDTDVPSIHGETLQQTSTLSKESYVYDNDGRLTETEETPTGKGCKSRLYAYDEEGNRTSETTRESSTETCATESGLLQTHTYDSANHLIDTGVKYETFGNTLELPEADAEGHALTSACYVDNQVESQTQNGTTNEYVYDPAGRTIETKSEVKSTKVKTTSIPHYSGPGEALTWASEEEEKGTEKVKKWTRNIPGIDGALDAIEKSGEETKPVLQIHDLQGNIVGEAADSETETKILKSYNSTEFGVPNEGKAPPKYAWLGAGGVASETSFDTGTVTQGGASYVPQVARNLQTAPVVPPGAFPDGQGTGSENTSEIPGWSTALANQESANTVAEYTAKLEAERKQKEKEAVETAERLAVERNEMEALNPNRGGVEEGLVVTGVYEQPGSDSGEPVANAANHVSCAFTQMPQSVEEGFKCKVYVGEIKGGECLAEIEGIVSKCSEILGRAKTEYGEGNHQACDKSVSYVGFAIGLGSKQALLKALGVIVGISVNFSTKAQEFVCG
jgi:YD repeat-containing protein